MLSKLLPQKTEFLRCSPSTSRAASRGRACCAAPPRVLREEQDPKNLIKWKEIYDDIEAAIDCCDDVANVVEGVALENA